MRLLFLQLSSGIHWRRYFLQQNLEHAVKLAAMHLYHECGMDLDLHGSGGRLAQTTLEYGIADPRKLADEYRFIANKARTHGDVALWYVQCALKWFPICAAQWYSACTVLKDPSGALPLCMAIGVSQSGLHFCTGAFYVVAPTSRAPSTAPECNVN